MTYLHSPIRIAHPAAITCVLAALMALMCIAGPATAGEFPDGALTEERAVVPAGGGSPPISTYPWRARMQHGARYAMRRDGRVSFAVVDETGTVRGYYGARQYYSASVVKAMLMVCYLNHRSVRNRSLTAGDRDLVGPMITRSDNARASRIFRMVGRSCLSRIARKAGMRNFRTTPNWAETRITAADQARLFVRIDYLTYPRHRLYGRNLLANIVSSQRWGIPKAAPGGWKVHFKGGWRRLRGTQLSHQAALLRKGERRYSIVVLTDGKRSQAYGRETIKGVAERVLRNYNGYD